MSTVSMSTVSMSTGNTATGFGGAFGPARTRSVEPRLHLTKRGRTVFTTLAAVPLVIGALVFALNGGGAAASLSGSDASFQYVTVASGQSLWQVAARLAPQADPRDVIAQLVQLNQLKSADVFAGQQLAIPAQYAK